MTLEDYEEWLELLGGLLWPSTGYRIMPCLDKIEWYIISLKYKGTSKKSHVGIDLKAHMDSEALINLSDWKKYSISILRVC